MSAFTLTKASEHALADALRTSMTIKLELNASSVVAWANLCTEHAGDQLEAVITHGPRCGSLILNARDDGNAQHLADFIEAVVNDTTETSQPTPTGVSRRRESGAQPHPGVQFLTDTAAKHADSTLCVTDINSLTVACQRGGACGLLMGALVIVHRSSDSYRTAIAALNGSTHIVSGSVRDVTSAMRGHIEQLLDAA